MRRQALNKCCQDCLKAESAEDLLSKKNLFDQLDAYAQKISGISQDQDYVPDNDRRQQSLLQLQKAADNAYNDYATGQKDINEILYHLVKQVDKIANEANADHKNTSKFALISQSTLYSIIQKIPKPVFKYSEAANDSSYNPTLPQKKLEKKSQSSGWSVLSIWCTQDSAAADPPSTTNISTSRSNTLTKQEKKD